MLDSWLCFVIHYIGSHRPLRLTLRPTILRLPGDSTRRFAYCRYFHPVVVVVGYEEDDEKRRESSDSSRTSARITDSRDRVVKVTSCLKFHARPNEKHSRLEAKRVYANCLTCVIHTYTYTRLQTFPGQLWPNIHSPFVSSILSNSTNQLFKIGTLHFGEN